MDKAIPRFINTVAPLPVHQQRSSTNSTSINDIRLPRRLRFSKSNVMRILRPALLVLADLIALCLSAVITQASCYYLGASCLNLVRGDIAFIAFSALCLMALVKSYDAGDGRRNYLGISSALFLTSLLVLHLSNHELESFPTIDWQLRCKETLMIWVISSAVISLGRYTVDRLIELLRRSNAINQSALHYNVLAISEPGNQNLMRSLIDSESRYNLVGIDASSTLDRENRIHLINKVIELRIDEIFIDWLSIERRPFLFQYLKSSGATVRVMTLDSSIALKNLELISSDSSITAFTLQSDPPLISLFVLKRFADIFASALALIALSVPLLIISALIKLDSPGPVFYKQTRVGLKGKEFKVWKFRSMVPDADLGQAVLEQRNESTDGVLFKIKDDPRITKLGAFLRKYSIDEIPQLINVLLGQMSIVGPRPLPVRDVQRFSEESFFIRHEVLPGITGLWQVSGRSDIEDFNQAVQLDMSYIENWSLPLDFRIILRTIAVVLTHKGAY